MNNFKLDSEPKIKSGFEIPEHYFDTFSGNVIQQLPKQETKVISIYQKRKTWIMSVAAVLVLGLFVPVYNNFSTKTTDIDDSTLENYITNQSNINQYDLVSLLEPEDIDNIKIDNVPVEDKTLEDMLSTNNNLENIITE